MNFKVEYTASNLGTLPFDKSVDRMNTVMSTLGEKIKEYAPHIAKSGGFTLMIKDNHSTLKLDVSVHAPNLPPEVLKVVEAQLRVM